MPDRPPFPIPDELEPETFCLCLQIPNDPIWKTVFSGLLWMPAEWFNWQRDDDKSGRVLAHYWRELYNQIDWSTMSCCCDDTILIGQISPTGEYEESDDGGVTYVPAPQHDPRNAVPRLPPALPPGTVDNKCTYSDSVVELFKQGVIDVLEEASTVQEIIAIITGILAGVLGFAGGVLTFIGAVIAVLANAIFALGVTLVQDAFTEDFWNDLRCLIYENINEDGSFSQTQIDSIYAGMSGDPVAIFITQNWIAALGTAGLTNSARALYGDPEATCDCGNTCGDIWSTYPSVEGYFGQIDEVGDGYIIASTLNVNTDGHYYIYLVTDNPSTCCYVNDIEYLDGTAALAWGNCGDPLLTLHTGIFTEGCVNQLQPANNTTPFTVKFTMVACP